MTTEEKMSMVKTIMEFEPDDTSEDERITVYLKASEKEILAWRYSYASKIPDAVPTEYEMTQIFAVIAGFGTAGAENQRSHHEGSIVRIFKYEDMVAYIRGHVIPIVRCI